jgi:hypothetical protein
MCILLYLAVDTAFAGYFQVKEIERTTDDAVYYMRYNERIK